MIAGGKNKYYYALDWQTRKIICEGITSGTAVLKYVGTGISATGDTLVPENMIPVIESYMMWKKSLWNRESRPHARTYKQLYWDEINAYRHIVQALTHDEVRDILWGVPPDNLTTNAVSADYAPLPDAPVATASTGDGDTYFTTNWGTVTGATGYYLDIATDSSFKEIVPGYYSRDVGAVITLLITGLALTTVYYYRVRAYNASGTSPNSNTITTETSSTYVLTDYDDNVYTDVIAFPYKSFIPVPKIMLYVDVAVNAA